MTKRNVSLNQLILNLFNVRVPPLNTGSKTEVKPTTFRPSAETAHFFEYHADRLNISMQDMMSLAMNAVVASTTTPVRTEFQLAVDRFKYIFKAHRIPQIHAKQIIDSYGEINFPLGAMTNDKIMLENYIPSVKESLSKTFSVRGAWLDGTDDRSIRAEPIYSRDYAFSVWNQINKPVQLKDISIIDRSLIVLKSESDNGVEIDGRNLPFEVLLFTVIERQVDNHMRFKTFELNGIFPLSNKEARICLEALLKAANKIGGGLSLNGASYCQDTITDIKLGLLPADCLKDEFPTFWDPDLLISESEEVNMLVELLITS